MATPTVPLGADYANSNLSSFGITPSAPLGKLLISTVGALNVVRPEPPATVKVTASAVDRFATLIGWCGGSPQANLPVGFGGVGQYVAFYYLDNPTNGVVNTIGDLAVGGVPATFRNSTAWVVYGEPAGMPRHILYGRDDSDRRNGVVTNGYTVDALDIFESGDAVLIAAATDNATTTTLTTTSSVAGPITLGTTATQTGASTLTSTSATYIPSATGAATFSFAAGGGSSATLLHMMAVLLRGTGYTPVNWISIDPPVRPVYGHNEVSVTLNGSYEEAAGTVFTTMEIEDYDPLNGTVNSTWTAHAVTLDAVNQRWASTTPWTLPDDGRHALSVRLLNQFGVVVATSQRQWRPMVITENMDGMGSSSMDLFCFDPTSSASRLPIQAWRQWRYDPNYTGTDKYQEDSIGASARGWAFQLLGILDDERGHNRSNLCVADIGVAGSSSAAWNDPTDPDVLKALAFDTEINGADIITHIGTVTNSVRSVTNNSGKASKLSLEAEMDTVKDNMRVVFGANRPFIWAEANQFQPETGTCAPAGVADCELGAKNSYQNLIWYNEILMDYEAADANFYKGPGARFAALNGIHLADGGGLYYGQVYAYLCAAILLGDPTLSKRGPKLLSVFADPDPLYPTSLIFQFDRSITSSRRGLTGVTGAAIATDDTFTTLKPTTDYTLTITSLGSTDLRATPTVGTFAGYTEAGYGLGAGTAEADMSNCVASAEETGVEWLATDALVGYVVNTREDGVNSIAMNLASAVLPYGRAIEAGDYLPITYQQGANGNPTPPTGMTTSSSDVIGTQLTSGNWGGAGPGQTSGARLWVKRIRESERAGSYTYTGTATTGRARMLFGPIIRGSTRSALAYFNTVTGADFTDADGWTKQTGSRSFVAVIWGLPTMVSVTPPAGWETLLAPTLFGTSGKDWLVAMFILRSTDAYVNGTPVSFTGMSGSDAKAGYILDLYRA